jgi:hypothetical protein
VRPERIRLEHEPEVARFGRHFAPGGSVEHDLVADEDAPLVRRLESADRAKQRRLSAADGPSSETTSPRSRVIDTPFRIGLVP